MTYEIKSSADKTCLFTMTFVYHRISTNLGKVILITDKSRQQRVGYVTYVGIFSGTQRNVRKLFEKNGT